MKFFNLDLHIGVIGDIRKILTDLGHEVEDWTLSAHAWVLGRKRDPVDVIDHRNWRSIDQAMADAFYTRYRDRLSDVDAFIVTHTPCFATLFERWNKPIITVASTRYEHPFTSDRVRWDWLNSFLVRGIDTGQIVALSNNKYDSRYAELFTQRPWKVIPSLCEYTGIRYAPVHDQLLTFSKSDVPIDSEKFVSRESLKPNWFQRKLNRIPLAPKRYGFSWQDMGTYKGIVHLPYNASIMSIFEHYSANIPLLFPTKEYAVEMMKNGEAGVFSELSFNQVLKRKSGSDVPVSYPDPNDYEDYVGMSEWIRLSDFYDINNMPHLTYFSSIEELTDIVSDMDFVAVSKNMALSNVDRRGRVYAAWAEVVAAL
jgi:hypothetical protein